MANQTISAITFDLGTYKVYDASVGHDVNRTVQGTLYTVEGITDANNQLRKLSIAELVMVVCLARASEKEQAVIALMQEMSETTNILGYLTDIETQILAGTNVNSVRGEYYYNGYTYTKASDFLKVCLYGYSNTDPNAVQLDDIYNKMANGTSLFDITDHYNGKNALDFLEDMNAMNSDIHGLYNMVYDMPDNGYPTGSQLSIINLFSSLDSVHGTVNLPVGSTWQDVKDELDSLYENDIMESTISRANQLNSAYLDSISLPAKDQLITDIESKMDSLNSFSQQKMIELQSETNKRDQAYDMITNILKSLNTVEVGIVNNI